MTIETAIKNRFRELYKKGIHVWVNGGEIERKLADQLGRKPSTISRTLRAMTENNQGEWLEKEERKCKGSNAESVWYRYKPSKYDVAV